MNGEQNPVGVTEVAGDALSVHLDSRYTVGELLRHSAHGRVHRARVRDLSLIHISEPTRPY